MLVVPVDEPGRGPPGPLAEGLEPRGRPAEVLEAHGAPEPDAQRAQLPAGRFFFMEF